MAKLDDLEFRITASTDLLRTQLAQGSDQIQQFSNRTQGQFEQVNRGVGRMVRSFREAFGVLGVAFGVRAFEGWVASSVQAQKAAGDTSAEFKRLQEATEKYKKASSELGAIFGQSLTPAIELATKALIGWRSILNGGQDTPLNQQLEKLKAQLKSMRTQFEASGGMGVEWLDDFSKKMVEVQKQIEALTPKALDEAMGIGTGPDSTLDQYKNELAVLKEAAAERAEMDKETVEQYQREIDLQKELNAEVQDQLGDIEVNAGEALKSMPDFNPYFQKLTDESKKFAQSFGSGLHNALVDFIIDGQRSFGDFLKRLAAEVAVSGIFDLISGSLAGSTGGVGKFFSQAFAGRAVGGPVDAGMPYLVGERGPELFMPRVSGSIVPHGGGGGATVVQNISVTADEPSIEARMAIATRVAASAAAQAVLTMLGPTR